jgi:PAS domain S-box-containing protein
MDDGVIVLDSEQTIAELNPTAEAMLGLQNAQVVGQPITGVFLQYPDLSIQPDGSRHEVSMKVKEQERHYELRVLPIRRRADAFLGSLVVLHDVTARYEVEHQRLQLAVERNQMEVLQRFVRDASHDLKTPLAIMNTSVYLLEQEFGKHPHRDALQFQITRLTQLIQDMLAMVRLDSVNSFEREPADLNSLITGIIEDLQPSAAKKNLTLHFECDSTLPLVAVNMDEMDMALRKLLINAITYTPDEGVVTVTMSTSDSEHLSISIRDTGLGIDAEDLPHIFERNYRGDKARGMAEGGSGLGLSIARRVVELHDGEIQVETAAGEGSTFRILLPLHGTPN